MNTETTPTKFQPLPLRHHDTGGFRLSAGTQTLNAVTGNYTGTTAIAAGADLVLIGGTNIAVSSGVADAGTFDISGNGNTSIARLTGTGGQVNLGANTLTVMGSGNFTTGTLGAVGDTGGLTVSGSGTQMVFSGVTGHYTGVTTIDAGTTLSLSKGSDISTSSNVVDNGTFAIASNGNTTITSLSSTNSAAIVSLGSNTLTLSNASGTYAGAIAGTGGALTLASGTEILTGTSSYTGPTNVNGGTLQAGATNAFAPSSAFTVASGTTLNLSSLNQTIGSLAGSGIVTLGSAMLTTGGNNASTTFSGVISGTGSVAKTGNGAFTLSGANTYTGGTNLSAGRLVVGNNGAFGTGPVAMAAGTTMSFLNTGNFTVANNIKISGDPTFSPPSGTTQTISGVISDGSSPGTMVLSGGGTLVLSAINTYTGPTTVNSGTLDVTGSIASSGLTVNSGSTLSGPGTVGTTQINSGGNFAPGTGAPGTSTSVSGSLAFQSGAIYMVQLNPSSASFASVTGTASLNGTVSANFASGNYVVSQYTILQSAGLNGSKFSGLTNTNLPANFTAVLTYTADDVNLNLLSAAGLINPNNKYNNNQAGVANALNAYLFSGGTLTPNVASLYGLTGTSLTTALTQLSGEVAADAERGAFEMMNQFLNVMLDPFVDGRLGSGIGGASGQAMGFASEDLASLPPDIALAYGEVLKAPPPVPFQQRWTAWGAA